MIEKINFVKTINNKKINTMISNGDISIEKAYGILKKQEEYKNISKPKNFVYFVEASNGRIKIGTSSNIKRRFNQLKSSSPCELKLLGTIEGNKTEERQIHERFKRYNTHGEWFLGVTAIWDYIKKYVKSEE